MKAVSAAFTDAIQRDHKIAVQVDVQTSAGVLLRRLTGLKSAPFPGTVPAVTGGTVTLDQTAAIRARADLQLFDDGTLELVPTGAGSLLAPYGNQLIVRRGLVHTTGRVELVRLGTFRIEDTDVEESADGLLIQVSGLDYAAIVIDAKTETPMEIADGTTIEAAILALVAPALPVLVTDMPATGFTTPKLVAEEGSDPWELAQRIARAAGLTLYFDQDAVLTLRTPPAGSPVRTISEGVNGVLLRASRRWTRVGAKNRMIATGENTGEATPVRGVWTDTDPASPTQYGGPFGRVPEFFNSQIIQTADQADQAAAAEGAKVRGTTQEVSFGALVDPTLEPGDIVHIKRARAGIDENHVLDTVTIPLAPDGALDSRTRAVLVA